MTSNSVRVHGLWALGLVGAFFFGTVWKKEPASAVPSPANATPTERRLSDAGASSGSRGFSEGTSSRSGRTASGADDLISSVFNSATLSNGGIEALTLEAFNDPNQVKRRLAFSRLLSGLTAENGASIRDQLVEAGAGGQEWRDFNYAWGAIAGEEAFAKAATGEKRDLEALISGWAATDPAGAIAMLEKLPGDLIDQKTKLENGIVAGLADRDRDEATKYVTALAAGGREEASRLMETVANEVLRQGGATEAAAWVATLDDGPLKGSAMNEVAERFVRNDPEAAAGWIAQFATEEYATRAVAEVGKTWAEREPLAAVNWLDELPEGPGQKAGLNSAFGDWEDKDPKAAGEYLLSMPGSAKRDSAISGFAAGYAWQDPETAIAWAQDIQDPGMRNDSLKRVGYAYFRRNPDEAKTWLANSGLSAEVQAAIQAPRNRRR
ncbi:MAG: hypothetical protein ACJAVK_001077 [Akkermansiaceae bacterium]|jgi:hypothetical protein